MHVALASALPIDKDEPILYLEMAAAAAHRFDYDREKLERKRYNSFITKRSVAHREGNIDRTLRCDRKCRFLIDFHLLLCFTVYTFIATRLDMHISFDFSLFSARRLFASLALSDSVCDIRSAG